MAKFLAQTSRGLGGALEAELHALEIAKTTITPHGVSFESNWQGCYRANLQLRTASRILLPVLDFPAYQTEDIYNNLKKHDFTKYCKPNQTLAVNASVSESKLRDQRIVALKVKDAIVDQFRDKFGHRPDVEKSDPDLLIHVRVYKNTVSVSIDTTGLPLFKRGYRKQAGDAPLKEHLAAGLIQLTGWKCDVPVVDLMCGSGTFLIEAALMALKQSPGLNRKKFAFQNFTLYDEGQFNQEVEAALSDEIEELPYKFYGYDIDFRAVKLARANVMSAGLSDLIEINKAPVDTVEAPCAEGMVVVNPPYGERLGNPEVLKDDYRDLGFILKNQFKGWPCWILSGKPELISAMKLKSSRKHFIMNGPIECRWLRYDMF